MKKGIFTALIIGIIVTFAQATPANASAACMSFPADLSQGMRGQSVRDLQMFLVARNYPGGGSWMVTGYYGSATAAAVRNFQREIGLAATGVAGRETRDAITRVSCGGASYPSYLQNQNPYTYGYTYPYNQTYQTQLPYASYGTPVLSALSVNTGGPGTVVTVWGSSFDYVNNTVYFGATALGGIASQNGTSLSFTVPSNASSGNVDVKVGNTRGVSNALAFNMTTVYQYPTYPYNTCGTYPYAYTNCGSVQWGGTPVVTYLSPASGAVGVSVTIYGSGFTQTGNTVHFGQGIITNISSPDGRAVSFTVPSTLIGYGTQPVTLATYNVSVTNSQGYVSNQLPFTVTSLGTAGQPTVTNVTGPTTLSAGTVGTWSITANNPGGSYLSVSVDWGDSGVYPAAATASQTLSQATQQLTFTHSYAQTGTYTIRFTVTNTAGQTNSVTTTVTVSGTAYGAVTLAGISPTSGRTGTLVTLTGTGFTQDNTVHFGTGGTQHLPSYNGTTISFTVPSYLSPCDLLQQGYACAMVVQIVTPGSYPVSVTNGSGTTQQLTFTVIQ